MKGLLAITFFTGHHKPDWFIYTPPDIHSFHKVVPQGSRSVRPHSDIPGIPGLGSTHSHQQISRKPFSLVFSHWATMSASQTSFPNKALLSVLRERCSALGPEDKTSQQSLSALQAPRRLGEVLVGEGLPLPVLLLAGPPPVVLGLDDLVLRLDDVILSLDDPDEWCR